MIKLQTEEEEGVKSSLLTSISAISSEIMALERLLVEKRHEERKLRNSLEEVDLRIGGIRKKYQKQLVRIQDKKENLLSSRSELQQEQVSLESERECHRREVQEAEELSRRWDDCCAGIDSSCKHIQLLCDALEYMKRERVSAARCVCVVRCAVTSVCRCID